MIVACTVALISLRSKDDYTSHLHIHSAKIDLSFVQVLNEIRNGGYRATLEVDHVYILFEHPKAKSNDSTSSIPTRSEYRRIRSRNL